MAWVLLPPLRKQWRLSIDLEKNDFLYTHTFLYLSLFLLNLFFVWGLEAQSFYQLFVYQFFQRIFLNLILLSQVYYDGSGGIVLEIFVCVSSCLLGWVFESFRQREIDVLDVLFQKSVFARSLFLSPLWH